MSVLRANAIVEVLAPGKTRRSGTFDDGRTWAVEDVTVVDQDRNKVQLRVKEGVNIEPGVYHVAIDTTTKGAAKTVIVHAERAKQ